MNSRKALLIAAAVLVIASLGAVVILSEENDPSKTPVTEAVATAPEQSKSDSRDGNRTQSYRPKPDTPEAKVYENADNLYKVIEVTDRERGKKGPVPGVDKAIDRLVRQVCDLMSEAALKQIQQSSPALSEDRMTACKQSTGLSFGRVARSGRLARSVNPTITDVRVDGDRATVTLVFTNGSTQTLRMVREGGSWKLDAEPTT